MLISRLGSELTLQRQLKEEAKSTVQRLMVSVQYTAVSVFFRSKDFLFSGFLNVFLIHRNYIMSYMPSTDMSKIIDGNFRMRRI